MRAFNSLSDEEIEKNFYISPHNISNKTNREYLAYSLGATLYIPALRKEISKVIYKEKNKYRNIQSVVICLEDSISEQDVEKAESNVIKICKQMIEDIEIKKIKSNKLPLIFIRVRNIKQFQRLVNKKCNFEYITGFVFPKFDSENAEQYLRILNEFNEGKNHVIYGMPILESKNIIYKESRISELLKIKSIIDKYRKYILNIRIGATDYQGLYSLRRGVNNSIYDVGVVSGCIYDMINIFSRADSEYIISGPVWEYFCSKNQILLKEENKSLLNNDKNIEKKYDSQWKKGLIREVMLDKCNGVVGKTVIHPDHVNIVNALYVVRKEEYEDALDILNMNFQGVSKSKYNNKMNETKPHFNWANKIMKRAYVFGVIKDEFDYKKLVQILQKVDIR